MALSRRSIRKDTLRARRVWNAAAQESRTMPEYQAAMHLLTAARIVDRMLRNYELDEPSDDDVEAGFGPDTD